MEKKGWVFDAHCDSLTARNPQDLLKEGTEGHWDIPRFLKGGGAFQILAIYTPSSLSGKEAFYYALRYFESAWQMMEASEGRLKFVLTSSDLVPEAGVVKGILSLEGGSPLMGEVEALRVFYRLGLRCLTLTWNHRNELADGVGVGHYPSGLTEAGKKILQECEELGIVVDVSHLAEPGFWDVVEYANQPFIASHSNFREVCDCFRNLGQRQAEAVASVGGVIGLTFVQDFVYSSTPESPPLSLPEKLEKFLNHAMALKNVAGVNTIGLGSDFDGTKNPILPDASCYPILRDAFLQSGFTLEEVENIFCGNFLRVFQSRLR